MSALSLYWCPEEHSHCRDSNQGFLRFIERLYVTLCASLMCIFQETLQFESSSGTHISKYVKKATLLKTCSGVINQDRVCSLRHLHRLVEYFHRLRSAISKIQPNWKEAA